jgi:hypothetical protein
MTEPTSTDDDFGGTYMTKTAREPNTIDVSTNVTLRILADELDPAAVSEEMSMTPHSCHKIGGVRDGRTLVSKKCGYWSITSLRNIATSADTNEHIRWT